MSTLDTYHKVIERKLFEFEFTSIFKNGGNMRSLIIVISLLIFLPSLTIATDIEVLHTFGNWRIQNEANNSYLLIGVGDVTDPGKKYLGARFFNIQCWKEIPNVLRILIPNDLLQPFNMKESKKSKICKVIIWADRNATEEIILDYIGHNDVMLISEGMQNDNVASSNLVKVLVSSKEKFSISFNGKTVVYDTRDFVPAWSTFRKICGSP